MVTGLHDMKLIQSYHFASDGFEQVERTKGVASALHEEDRRSQREEHLVAQFAPGPRRRRAGKRGRQLR